MPNLHNDMIVIGRSRNLELEPQRIRGYAIKAD